MVNEIMNTKTNATDNGGFRDSSQPYRPTDVVAATYILVNGFLLEDGGGNLPSLVIQSVV